jgi:hypothetical protein
VRRLPAVTLVAALLVGACSAAPPAASPAPSLTDPAQTAMQQVTRFFDLLKNRDSAGLANFLSPAFTLQRADGSGANKTEYLAVEPATITSYTITNLQATNINGTLTARYMADVQGEVDGKPYTPGPAPRLSVFIWTGTDWQLLAHANFNPLTG